MLGTPLAEASAGWGLVPIGARGLVLAAVVISLAVVLLELMARTRRLPWRRRRG